MIAAALALAAALPVEQAERAFASLAQTKGQWTAFRAFAAPDAVMFAPRDVRARDWLDGRPDPKTAVMWWPARILISCDGALAVSTGSWMNGGVHGYFTTVWQRQPNGRWKWLLDHGDTLERPRPVPEHPEVIEAGCPARLPADQQFVPPIIDGPGNWGSSHDGSLAWIWTIEGDRLYLKAYAMGRRDPVIADEVVLP